MWQRKPSTQIEFVGTRAEARAKILVDDQMVGSLPERAPEWLDTGEWADRDAVVLTLTRRVSCEKHRLTVVTVQGDTLRSEFTAHSSGRIVISSAERRLYAR